MRDIDSTVIVSRNVVTYECLTLSLDTQIQFSDQPTLLFIIIKDAFRLVHGFPGIPFDSFDKKRTNYMH